MRNNIVVMGPGLPKQTPGETYAVSEGIIGDLLVKAGYNKIDLPEIDRAHRSGPRLLICRFLRWKDQQEAINRCRVLAAQGIYVREQLAPESIVLRKQLRAAAERKWGPLGNGQPGQGVKVIHNLDNIKVLGERWALGDGGELVPYMRRVSAASGGNLTPVGQA